MAIALLLLFIAASWALHVHPGFIAALCVMLLISVVIDARRLNRSIRCEQSR